MQPGDDRAVIFAPVSVGAALLDLGAPRTVELRAKNPGDAWHVASVVQNEVPKEVEVVSFEALNRPLLAALALERAMIGFGVALVMAVAALNLLCNLALLAAEKRADVALLTALGVTPARVRRLFLLLGVGVGALGGVLGTALGGLAAEVLDRTRALPLPRGVFIVSHVPFRVTPGAVAIVLGGLAARRPARLAGAGPRRLPQRRLGRAAV